MRSSPELPQVRYALAAPGAGWELGEETLPESVLHDEAVALLEALLAVWAARRGDAMVVRNLAVRWDQAHPAFGVDPDVAVIVPRPPEGDDLRSLRTWREGHAAPMLAIEVVSETTPRKDYVVAPDKYAASGVGELWIFDPLLSGPASHGGPFRLQVWTRDDDGTFSRAYAGDGPARSPALGAYLVPVDEGRKLRIAADAEATDSWMTEAEAHRKERDEALARLREVEAELAARGGR